MLRIFTSVKIQRLRPGSNPQTWLPEASMLTTRPPKPSIRVTRFLQLFYHQSILRSIWNVLKLEKTGTSKILGTQMPIYIAFYAKGLIFKKKEMYKIKQCILSRITTSIPVVVRSKAWVCGRSLAAILCSNHTGGMDISCKCCVLSGRGFCVWLITRPEKSYRVLCDRESIDNVEALVHWGLLCHG